MDTKLTLKLNKQVIDKAKIYAASQKRSLSGLIESYLKTLVNTENSQQSDEIEISPYVKSMKTGIHLPADLDEKKAYREHIAEKHS